MSGFRAGKRATHLISQGVYWVLSLLLSACISATRPVVKIALVAPFEGRYREVGYEVIYAVRLAVREANTNGGVAGSSVELMAFDDSGDPEMAVAQARKAAADPQVVAALGHWRESTTLAAAPEYASAGLPLLATTSALNLPASSFRLWLTEAVYADALRPALHCPLPCDSLEDLSWLLTQPLPATRKAIVAGPPVWGQPQFAQLAGDYAEAVHVITPAPLPVDSSDPSFADRYRAISNGVEPRFNAVLAYDAARLLLEAIARDIQANGQPSRAGVAAALAQSGYTGLSGHFSFDSAHNWEEGKGWVYQWREGEMIRP
jgi:ABC-type branched-subunit amino acid transport system substrate-binding protein